MLKERIQEIFEFIKSESPYRKANQGWINQDIFLDLSPSFDALKQKNEAAKVTIFWSPINNLLSNIFIILIASSLLVFTSLSFVKGRFDFDFFNASLVKEIVKVEDNTVLETTDLNDLDSRIAENQNNIDINELGKSNEINSLDNHQINLDQKTIANQINKEENRIKETKSNKDIKNLENKKSKSNFI